MPLNTRIETINLSPTDPERRRIDRQMRGLARRLAHYPESQAVAVLTEHVGQRQIEVDLRVQLGPLGSHLVSHQLAETADRAVHLAIEDVERQLERHNASLRREASYGVPSRRPPTWRQPGIPPLESTEPPSGSGDHRENPAS